MSKKYQIFLLSFLLFISVLNAQDEYGEYSPVCGPGVIYAETKVLFAEAGYGPRDLTLGIGFRWDFIGLDINLGGFMDNTPNYMYATKQYPYPKEFNEYTYARTTLTINASYYYDYEEYSFFASVGYFNQVDTALVRSLDAGGTRGVFFPRRGNPAIKTSGICFGLGANYFIDEKYVAGLGYHTKKGVFLQFGYYFY